MARHFREMLPEEVVELHDEESVPWPVWYIGPFVDSSPEDAAAAIAKLEEGLSGLPEEDGDQPVSVPDAAL